MRSNSASGQASRRAAIVAIALTTYGVFLALESQRGFPSSLRIAPGFPFLSDKPVGEDGFYILTVAWNIARGQGITYGLQGATTGIQPLVTFVTAAIAWVVQACAGDKYTLVRVMLVVGVMEQLLLAALLGRLAARAYAGDADRARLASHVAFVACACSFTLFRWLTYGLETGIYLIGLAAFALQLDRQLADARPRRVLLLGLSAGLIGLCRLDFGVVFAATLGWLLLRRQISVRNALTIGGIAGVVAFPWLGFVHATSGHWVPSSGTAQADALTLATLPERLQMMFAGVVGVCSPWTYVQVGASGVVFGLLGLALLGTSLLRARALGPRSMASLHTVPGLRALLPGVLLLVPMYAATSGAGHFYQRYATPIAVLAIPALACAVVELLERHPRVARWWPDAALGGCFVVWALASLHLGRVGNNHAVSAGYLFQHTSASDRIGAFQSGVIGYFHDNVINLDGKLNHAALDARQRGALVEYIELARINVIIDWRDYLKSLPQSWLEAQWLPCGVDVPNGASVCLRRRR